MLIRCAPLLAALVLAACAAPTPTPTAAPSATPAPTRTPRPTVQPSVTPTASATPEPTPTLTPPPAPLPAPFDGAALPADAVAQLGGGRVRAVAPSPVDEVVLVGTTTQLALFSLPSLELLWQVRLSGPPQDIYWSPDGARFATVPDAADSGQGGLWDAATGERLTQFDVYGETVGWSADGSRLAVVASRVEFDAGYEVTITLHEAAAGAISGRLSAQSTDVDLLWLSSLTWSPDGSTLLAEIGNERGAVLVWDVATGVVDGPVEPDGGFLALNAEGDLMRVSFTGDDMRIINTATGEDQRVAGAGVGTGAPRVAWSPDRQTIAALFDDQLYLVAYPSGEVLGQDLPEADHSVRWYPGSERVLVDSGQVISTRTGDVVLAFDPPGPVAPTADDRYVMLQGDREAVSLWNVPTQQIAEQVVMALLGVDGLWWSDEEGIVLGLGTNYARWEPGGAQLEPLSGFEPPEPVREGLPDDAGDIVDTALSPDGTLIAVATIGAGFCGDGPFSGGCFTTSGGVALYDVASGELIAERQFERGIRAVAWSPGGATLAVGGGTGVQQAAENDILLLDATLGQVGVLRGHTLPVVGLAWSPDGGQLASLSEDGTVVVWAVP